MHRTAVPFRSSDITFFLESLQTLRNGCMANLQVGRSLTQAGRLSLFGDDLIQVLQQFVLFGAEFLSHIFLLLEKYR